MPCPLVSSLDLVNTMQHMQRRQCSSVPMKLKDFLYLFITALFKSISFQIIRLGLSKSKGQGKFQEMGFIEHFCVNANTIANAVSTTIHYWPFNLASIGAMNSIAQKRQDVLEVSARNIQLNSLSFSVHFLKASFQSIISNERSYFSGERKRVLKSE